MRGLPCPVPTEIERLRQEEPTCECCATSYEQGRLDGAAAVARQVAKEAAKNTLSSDALRGVVNQREPDIEPADTCLHCHGCGWDNPAIATEQCRMCGGSGHVPAAVARQEGYACGCDVTPFCTIHGAAAVAREPDKLRPADYVLGAREPQTDLAPEPACRSGEMRLTREQAAIIGAFTGTSCGPFSDIHKKIEDVLGRPVWTHEMASKDLLAQVKEAMKNEFLSICADESIAAQPADKRDAE